MTKERKLKLLKREKEAENRRIRPFNCNEALLFRFCGEILASSAAEYKLAGQHVKQANRKYDLGQIDETELIKQVSTAEIAMKKEQVFMMSDRFKILLGPSELNGTDVIHMVEKEIAEYDPYEDVPDNNPKTGRPYHINEWKRKVNHERRLMKNASKQ